MADGVTYSIKCKLTIKHYNSFTTSSRVCDLVIETGNTTKKLPDSQISKNSEREGLDKEMNFSMGDLSFNKKVYQPNEINVTIKIQSFIDATDLENTQSLPDLSTIQKMFLNKLVDLEIGLYRNNETNADEIINAENYYIHDIKPRYKKSSASTAVEVALTIKSLDNLMTINKYSQAYLARKFKGEILASVNRFKLSYPSSEKLSTDQKEKLILKLNDELNLQNLFYGKDKIQKEFIQPYLVQYNESFYDFLVRVANRCGEFLYFEGGKLCVGLNFDIDSKSKKAKITKESQYIKLTSEDYSEVCFNTISDIEPLQVTDYARDSLKDSVTGFKYDGSDAQKSNFKQVHVSKKGEEIIYKDTGTTEELKFPKDTELGEKKDNEKKSDYIDYYYNSEISNDEFYMPLYKEGFSSDAFTDKMSEISRGSAEKHKAHVVATVLAATNLMDLILDLIEEYVELALVTETYKNTKNDRGKERFITPYSPTVESNRKGNDFNTEPAHVVPFSEDVTERWATLKYYSEIRHFQENLQRQMVEIIFETKIKDIKLGDIICLKDISDKTFYVVTEVNFIQKGDLSTTGNGSSGIQKVKAIPMLKNSDYYRAFPPLIDKEVFRFSGQQTAFVVDAADPKHQGRVRIRYPWQTNAEVIPVEEITTSDSKAKEIIKKYKEEKIRAASPWIRMAVPSSSKSGGIYFEAEPGDEVLVNFDNGNIERPFVVGALYSKNNIAPVAKGHRVLKSKFGHTLRFKDPSDGVSEVTDSLGVQRVMGQLLPITDMISLWSGKDLMESKDSNWDLLTGGIDLGDSFGIYNISMSSDERAIKISSPFGDVSINAFTGITLSAPNGNIKIEGKNIEISASNKVKITSGENLSQDSYIKSTILGDFSSLKDASSNIARRILDKYIPINLGLIRNVLEIVIRPIDGTLSLKSHGFVKIEAGEGNAEVPKDNYSSFYKKYLKKVDYDAKEEAINDAFALLTAHAAAISEIVDTVERDFTTLVTNFRNDLQGFYSTHVQNGNLNSSYPELISLLYETNGTPFGEKSDLNLSREERLRLSNIEDFDIRNTEIKRLLENANNDFKAIWDKFNNPESGVKFKDKLGERQISGLAESLQLDDSNLKNQLTSDISSVYGRKKYLFEYVSKTQDKNEALELLDPTKSLPDQASMQINAQHSKYELVKEVLSRFDQLLPDYKLTFTAPGDVSAGWDDAVKGLKIEIKPKPDTSTFLGKVAKVGQTIGTGILDVVSKDVKGFLSDLTIWQEGHGVKGKILMSEREDKTFQSDGQGGFAEVENEELVFDAKLSSKIVSLRDKLLFR